MWGVCTGEQGGEKGVCTLIFSIGGVCGVLQGRRGEKRGERGKRMNGSAVGWPTAANATEWCAHEFAQGRKALYALMSKNTLRLFMSEERPHAAR